MAIQNDVKQALGIFYSEVNKDNEIRQIISSAKDFLQKSGWPSEDLAEDAETPTAKQAIIIWAKMSVNTDPAEMRMNPMLVALIAQARASKPTESEEA